MRGRIHSFQSLGTVDGPGLRAVVFMQGCPLRCACCHNPDTWERSGGKEIDVQEVFDKIYRLRSYLCNGGGMTASGGEPLMQTEFLTELFALCKNAGISTALDTSGCIYNEKVEELLGLTDIVLLDYKYTNEEDYIKHVGMSKARVDEFLGHLQTLGKRVWIRHVVIPGLNDSEESVDKIYALAEKYTCIEKTELLPFRKLCLEKYHSLGVDFPIENTPEASEELMIKLKKDR